MKPYKVKVYFPPFIEVTILASCSQQAAVLGVLEYDAAKAAECELCIVQGSANGLIEPTETVST